MADKEYVLGNKARELLTYTNQATKIVTDDVSQRDVRKILQKIAALDDIRDVKQVCGQMIGYLDRKDKQGFTKAAYRCYGEDMRKTAKAIVRDIHAANGKMFVIEYEERLRLIGQILDGCSLMLEYIQICLDMGVISLEKSKVWTKKVLETCYASPCPGNAHGFMEGLSLHYYVHPGGWDDKGSATDFDEEAWYCTMGKALYMEELIGMHGAVLDQYDPGKEIGLIVDEWGTWYNVEPGTNPGFLYQQNTIRDALVAALHLNIFNKHCDRVKMACIAQMVNVLQSVILTEGEKMVLTPTYHVFHMFREHQGAELVESAVIGDGWITREGFDGPAIQESVSLKEDGSLLVTVANLSASDSYPVEIVFAEKKPRPGEVTGRILTGEIHAHNTFEEPDKVKEVAFEGIAATKEGISFTIPAHSVASLHIR